MHLVPPTPLSHAGIDLRLGRLEQRLEELRVLLRREEASDKDSVATPAAYEEADRAHLLDIFEDKFGLRAKHPPRPHRLRGEIQPSQGQGDSVEWDFRLPVMCIGSAPSHPDKNADFLIYPEHASYVRPLIPEFTRELTPTKIAGAIKETQSDFMAIFEITTMARWAPVLVPRLEQRLAVTLDRASSESLQPAGPKQLGILDVVAVVGVVGISSCLRSIPERVTKTSTPLLHKMMEAGRFVYVHLPYAGSPTPKSAGGSCTAPAGGASGKV